MYEKQSAFVLRKCHMKLLQEMHYLQPICWKWESFEANVNWYQELGKIMIMIIQMLIFHVVKSS